MSQRRLLIVLFLVGLASLPGSVASAQSFLDKLEKTVREQLQQPANPNAATEELPAPKADRSQVPPPAVGQPATPVGPPAGSVPSLAPSPFNAAPASDSGASEPGSIYLGIEVEAPIGAGIGVRISSVESKSPAYKGDLRVGDRILAINGFAIANIDNMVTQLGKTRPGETVKFLLSRSGQNLERRAVLMDAELAARIQNSQPVAAGKAWLGVQVNDLTDSFRRRFGLGVYRGAAIVEVTPGSPAAKASFKPGEVIADVNGTPIESAATLTRWVSSARPGERAEFLVYRGGKSRIVEIVLEADPSANDSRSRPRTVLQQPSPTYASPLPNNASPNSALPNSAIPSLAIPSSNMPSAANEAAGSTAPPPNSTLPANPPPSPLEMRPSLPAEAEIADAIDLSSSPQTGSQGEVVRLRQENADLREELARTKDKLNKLQTRVDTILKQLQIDQDN